MFCWFAATITMADPARIGKRRTARGKVQDRVVDLFLKLAERRSRLNAFCLPFSALRVRHWTEAVTDGAAAVSSVFSRFRTANYWAIIADTVKGKLAFLIDEYTYKIEVFDPALVLDADQKGLVLKLVKVYCTSKQLPFSAGKWCFLSQPVYKCKRADWFLDYALIWSLDQRLAKKPWPRELPVQTAVVDSYERQFARDKLDEPVPPEGGDNRPSHHQRKAHYKGRLRTKVLASEVHVVRKPTRPDLHRLHTAVVAAAAVNRPSCATARPPSRGDSDSPTFEEAYKKATDLHPSFSPDGSLNSRQVTRDRACSDDEATGPPAPTTDTIRRGTVIVSQEVAQPPLERAIVPLPPPYQPHPDDGWENLVVTVCSEPLLEPTVSAAIANPVEARAREMSGNVREEAEDVILGAEINNEDANKAEQQVAADEPMEIVGSIFDLPPELEGWSLVTDRPVEQRTQRTSRPHRMRSGRPRLLFLSPDGTRKKWIAVDRFPLGRRGRGGREARPY